MMARLPLASATASIPPPGLGSVVAVMVTLLLLLNFLDDPFHGGVGGLQPEAMERTERLIDQQLDVLAADLVLPCDDAGDPT